MRPEGEFWFDELVFDFHVFMIHTVEIPADYLKGDGASREHPSESHVKVISRSCRVVTSSSWAL